MTEDRKKASEEQLAYAGVLNIGMWIGLALLVVTFIVYIGSAAKLCADRKTFRNSQRFKCAILGHEST